VFDCVKDARSAVRYVARPRGELGIDRRRSSSAAARGRTSRGGDAMFDGVDEAARHEYFAGPECARAAVPGDRHVAQGYGNAKVGERWRELSPAHNVRSACRRQLPFMAPAIRRARSKGAQYFTMRCESRASQRARRERSGAHGYLMARSLCSTNASQVGCVSRVAVVAAGEEIVVHLPVKLLLLFTALGRSDGVGIARRLPQPAELAPPTTPSITRRRKSRANSRWR